MKNFGFDYFSSISGLKFFDPKNIEKIFDNLKNIKDLQNSPTESDIVFQEDMCRLHHYKNENYERPAILIYALINDLSILDLSKNTTLVGGLIENGVDLYGIDWGSPNPMDMYMDFDDLLYYLNEAVDFIIRDTGFDKVDFIMECQGGTLGFVYASLYPEKIGKIASISTPINFHVDSLSFNIARNIDTNYLYKANGNIPSSMVNSAFFMMYPFEALIGRYIKYLKDGGDMEFLREFLRFEEWIYSGSDISGSFFKTWIDSFCVNNELYKKKFIAQGELIDLKNIKSPILNIMGEFDKIAPLESSMPIESYTDCCKYEELIYPLDHLALITTKFTKEVLSKEIGKFLK